MPDPEALLNDRYSIERPIGRGATAATYLARERETDKPVVLKIIDLKKLPDWKTAELFEREAAALKTIDHPLVPDYIDSFREERAGELRYVLVQEFVDGKNLEELVRSGGRFDEKEVRALLVQLLGILAYLHNLNPPIIHRDINPRNVLVAGSGEVYLVDFGAVGALVHDTIAASRAETFVGTIGYMPPEQLFGKALPQSDLYALGMTALFLLTGKEPHTFEFNGEGFDVGAYANLDPTLAALLTRMLEPNYTKRLNDARRALDFLAGKTKVPRLAENAPLKGDAARFRVEEAVPGGKLVVLPRTPTVLTAILMNVGLFVPWWFASLFFDENTWNAGLAVFVACFAAFLLNFLLRPRVTLDLLPNEIRSVRTYLGFIRKRTSIPIRDYTGLARVSRGKNGGVFYYTLRIMAGKRRLNLGARFDADQVADLKTIIERHVGERLI